MSRWDEIQDLFHRVVVLPPDERERALADACRDDPELRTEVDELLSVADLDPEFMEDDASSDEIYFRVHGRHSEIPTDLVEGYEIIECLETGGMGSVYRALQLSPRRPVALKLLRSGLTRDRDLKRFEYESQVLARLRHHHIAQIFEAGTTNYHGEPIPYFAMEYVENAASITEYCRQHELSRNARMRLFREVCAAVHHGHQRGIIHRDLKPANILIDESGVVKLIDFGVAKALDPDHVLTKTAEDTRALVGTLPYMSPEQIGEDGDDLDIRSDVYSLGVVLFELLTDQHPHEFGRKPVTEILRMIREEAPAPNRSARLDGDLRTIVMKALEKDRERRYPSTAALAQDLERVEKHRPIEARPPSLVYQLRCFVRRNRAVSALLLLLVVTLVGATATSLHFGFDARDSARVAQHQQTVAEESLEIVQKILWGSLDVRANPELPRLLMAERLLELVDVEITEIEEPQVAANIFYTIGRTHQGIGDNEKAIEFFERSLDLAAELDPPDPELEVNCLALYGLSLLLIHEIERAERAIDRALEIEKRAAGEETPLRQAAILTQKARILDRTARYEEAIAVQEEAKRLFDTDPERDPENRGQCYHNLATYYKKTNRLDEAREAMQKSYEIRRDDKGESHITTLSSKRGLAATYYSMRELDRAEKVIGEVLASSREGVGAEDPFTLGAEDLRARVLLKQGEFRRALEILEPLLETRIRVEGEKSTGALATLETLGSAYYQTGRLEEHEEVLERMRTIKTEIYGEAHPEVLSVKGNLAVNYRNQERYEEAREILDELIPTYRDLLGEDHPRTLLTRSNLVTLLTAMKDFDAATRLGERVRDDYIRALGAEHLRSLTPQLNFAATFRNAERYPEAIREYERIIEMCERVRPDHYTTHVARGAYAICLERAGEHERARRLLPDVIEKLSGRYDDAHPYMVGFRNALANAEGADRN